MLNRIFQGRALRCGNGGELKAEVGKENPEDAVWAHERGFGELIEDEESQVEDGPVRKVCAVLYGVEISFAAKMEVKCKESHEADNPKTEEYFDVTAMRVRGCKPSCGLADAPR